MQREEVGYGYRTARVLGQGANGSVYLAREDSKGGQVCAVKTCSVAAAAWQHQMAQREASHLSQTAQHVSLVRPYSVSDASHFLNNFGRERLPSEAQRDTLWLRQQPLTSTASACKPTVPLKCGLFVNLGSDKGQQMSLR